jgi:hypothetical protein
MPSRSAQKRTGRVTPAVPKSQERVQLLRVAVQWSAVYTNGDEPPEEISSGVFQVPARDWPGIEKRINDDLARILEQIIEAGGFDAFQEQVRQQQAQQAQQQAPPG